MFLIVGRLLTNRWNWSVNDIISSQCLKDLRAVYVSSEWVKKDEKIF